MATHMAGALRASHYLLIYPMPNEPDWLKNKSSEFFFITSMGVWQGVAMDSLRYHLGPLSPTLLRPAGGPPLKWPYGRFRAGQAAKSCLLPFWTPHAVCLCFRLVSQGAAGGPRAPQFY
jgi:hypothetical protein